MNMIMQFVILAPPILLALTVHEFSHGLAADKLGDPTARLAGRLTLNPMAHLDLMGTLMMFIAHFGWAKPVPVDARNLQNPKQDMVWIALAGPLSNIVFALLIGFIIRFFGITPVAITRNILLFMLYFGIKINIGLAIFNLIPLPPLDGSKILMGLLPLRQAIKFSQIQQYGPLILFGLIMLDHYLHIPTISLLLGPPLKLLVAAFSGFYI